MASAPGSPTGQEAPGTEAQPQGRQRGSPKQFVGLSKNLNTKEKSFRYLDFAKGGTNAALNKWGQFLQFSRLVTGGGNPDSWNYVSVEPRDIFRLEHIALAQTPHESERGEEDDSYHLCQWYIRRHDKFDALCLENQGLGLRFSDDTKISELEHYYRNDRWPEVRYTVEGKVKVVLQHYIRDGEIIQDMCLTSGSGEETELSLEFEFATGISISVGDLIQTKGGEEDAHDHILEPAGEGEAPGSHWKIWRRNYYATASLFEDGKPKSFNLLGESKQDNRTKCDIGILSDDPVRYRETFILASEASVKFTSVFKLDHESVPNTLPQYFDISPHLRSFSGRWWWRFKNESSSFVFGRNLETILSHAMPLPQVDGEKYQPYVLHDHDLINTSQTWSNSLDQALYLLEIDKMLQQQNTADIETKSYYRRRIREVIFGYFVWLLQHAERNGFSETVILRWSGKLVLAKKDVGGELIERVKSEEEGGLVNGSTDKPSESGVAGPVGTPMPKINPTSPKTDSLLSKEASGSTTSLKNASTSHPGKPEEHVHRSSLGPFELPPPSSFEPELSGYGDKFKNCCWFLILLDMCLTNYPDEKPLITQIVEAFLKLAWEPIKMTKHGESNLWPDRLENLGEHPPPYARFLPSAQFLNPQTRKICGYGGQPTYVYDIVTQVLAWRAVKSTNNLLNLVSQDQNWKEWIDRQKGSLDDKAIRDQTMEAFPLLSADTSQNLSPDRFVSKIKGHVREPFLEKWVCDITAPSFVEDFFFNDKNEPIAAWTETLRYYDKFMESIKPQTLNT